MTAEKQKEERYKSVGWIVPDLHPLEFLHFVWQNIGEARDGQPLEWQELQAYANMTGETLEAEEWQIIADMSRAYCKELRNLSRFAKSPLDKAQEHD